MLLTTRIAPLSEEGRVVGTGRLLWVARTRTEIMETTDLQASFGFGQVVGSVAVYTMSLAV